MSVDDAVEREKELYAEIQQLQDKAFEANNHLLQQQLLLRRYVSIGRKPRNPKKKTHFLKCLCSVLEQPVLYKVVFPDGTEDSKPVDEYVPIPLPPTCRQHVS
jgi:hypothetical protein